MAKTRREFSPEFKREAVALLETSGRPLMQVAMEVGISPSMLRTWRALIRDGAARSRPAAPGIPLLPSPADQASEPRSGSRAAALLRLAATTIGRTDTALGAFYRRLSTRTGKAKAVTATARKIAVLFYNAVRHGMDYVDPGVSAYEDRYRARVIDNLQRRAKTFGFVLQPVGATMGAVS